MTKEELFDLGEENRKNTIPLRGWHVDISPMDVNAMFMTLSAHIRKATGKHPYFVQPDKALDVLMEEVCEVKEALDSRDIPLAIDELYDVATVALRWALRLYVENKHLL